MAYKMLHSPIRYDKKVGSMTFLQRVVSVGIYSTTSHDK